MVRLKPKSKPKPKDVDPFSSFSPHPGWEITADFYYEDDTSETYVVRDVSWRNKWGDLILDGSQLPEMDHFYNRGINQIIITHINKTEDILDSMISFTYGRLILKEIQPMSLRFKFMDVLTIRKDTDTKNVLHMRAIEKLILLTG